MPSPVFNRTPVKRVELRRPRGNTSPVKISIIVPAFNEERLLGNSLVTINSVRPVFTRAGFECELIVCDNNSTDRTAEIARAAGATVVFEPVNQIARARNTGARAATGDWLLFIDADSHPTAELFAEVTEQIQSGKCLAGGSTIRLEGNYRVANFVTGIWNWKSRSRRWLAGSFIFCDAAVFRKIAGFSHEFYAAEELDLSRRLREVAEVDGREIVILHRHPLLTSARKMQLYTTWEQVRLLLRVVWSRGRALRDRETCHSWYDGRR
ncbi:MAG: glycosyltransferase [Pedosphaera sp.]|nr:glycosyltransferase [Pedosphaera sp.]